MRFARRLCLATFLPYAALALVLIARPTAQQLGLVLLTLVGAPHVAAGFVFYVDRDARPMLRSQPARFFYVPAVILVGCTAFGFAAQDLAPEIVATVIAATVAWQVHHFARQNHGVLVLANRARGLARPSAEEIRIGWWIEAAAILLGLGVIRSVAGPYLIPDAVLSEVTPRLGGCAFVVAAGLTLLYACHNGHGGDRVRLALVSSQLLFFLPFLIFESPVLALGVFAAPHAYQYLVILWHLRDGRETAATRARVYTAALVAIGVAGGGLLYLSTRHPYGGPLLEGSLVGALRGLGIGFFLWHYLVDAGVWRLSRPDPRKYMTSRLPFLASSTRA